MPDANTLQLLYLFQQRISKEKIIMRVTYIYCALCKLITDSALKLDQKNGSCVQIVYHISELSVLQMIAYNANLFIYICLVFSISE